MARCWTTSLLHWPQMSSSPSHAAFLLILLHAPLAKLIQFYVTATLQERGLVEENMCICPFGKDEQANLWHVERNIRARPFWRIEKYNGNTASACPHCQKKLLSAEFQGPFYYLPSALQQGITWKQVMTVRVRNLRPRNLRPNDPPLGRLRNPLPSGDPQGSC